MARKKDSRGKHATDRLGAAVDAAGDKLHSENRDVAGPSPNPATNLLIHDVLLRSGGRLLRIGLEKGLLSNRYGGSTAKRMVENRSMVQNLATFAIARLATRSIPGAVLVGGGLLAKTLLDRRQSRRAARRKGDKALREQTKES
ncbi:hypothetical protein V5F89_00240 [Pelagerythrobacter marensis]|uniref:DUF4235 domain-containing protein n=1 Tax=Pelagerythrobacter marensis TaxID=543877 RepID=A0ABZ2D3N7_9SPHN